MNEDLSRLAAAGCGRQRIASGRDSLRASARFRRRSHSRATSFGAQPPHTGASTEGMTRSGRARGALIPARAGSTYRSARSSSPPRAHPRMRGEHHRHPVPHPHCGGSSPHARGAPTPPPTPRCGRGLATKLAQARIYTPADVERYAQAWWAPTQSHAALAAAVTPARDEFVNRWTDAKSQQDSQALDELRTFPEGLWLLRAPVRLHVSGLRLRHQRFGEAFGVPAPADTSAALGGGRGRRRRVRARAATGSSDRPGEGQHLSVR